jgi:uncharacterized membrane protein YbhN (UPF0104 family)
VRPNLRRLAWWLLGLACFGGVLAALVRSATVVAELEVRLRPLPLAASAVCFLVQHLLAAALWSDFLALTGSRGDRRRDAASWLLSQFGKYVPGNVSVLAIRAGRSSGTVEQVAGAMILEALGHGAAAALLGLPAAIGLARARPAAAAVVAFGLVSALVVVASGHPRRLLDALLRRLGRPPLLFVSPARGVLARTALALTVHWLLVGTSFWLLAHGLGHPFPWSIAAPAMTLAWLAGFLAIVVPGGLGVREGVLLLVLAPHLGVTASLLLAAASRAWVTGLDVVVSGGFALALRGRNRGAPPSQRGGSGAGA